MTVNTKTFDTDDRLSDWWSSLSHTWAWTTIINWTWRANTTDWQQILLKSWVTIWNWAYAEMKWYYWWAARWGSNRQIGWLLDSSTSWNNSLTISTQAYSAWGIYTIWLYKVVSNTRTALSEVTFASLWITVQTSIICRMEHKWDKIEFTIRKSSDNSLLHTYDCTDSWVLAQSFDNIQTQVHTTTDHYNYMEEINVAYDVTEDTFTPKIIQF